MKRLVIIGFLIPCVSFAQPTVAPTSETVGTARGDDWLGYNIRQSFEVGVRFLDVDGSREKYRSDVNYRNGLRLLSSRLEVHSKDGHGRFFDDLVLTTMGLGNDPYENAALKIEKNNLYRSILVLQTADIRRHRKDRSQVVIEEVDRCQSGSGLCIAGIAGKEPELSRRKQREVMILQSPSRVQRVIAIHQGQGRVVIIGQTPGKIVAV